MAGVRQILTSLHGKVFGIGHRGEIISRNKFNEVKGLQTKTTVTSAQVLALNATPQTVVAAPDSGYAIIVKQVRVHKPAGTAYAGIAAGEDLVLKYTNGSGAQVTSVIETTGFLDQTTAQTRVAFPPAATGSTAGDITPVSAAAVVLHLLVGEITTGDSALHVVVDYEIIKLAQTD